MARRLLFLIGAFIALLLLLAAPEAAVAAEPCGLSYDDVHPTKLSCGSLSGDCEGCAMARKLVAPFEIEIAEVRLYMSRSSDGLFRIGIYGNTIRDKTEGEVPSDYYLIESTGPASMWIGETEGWYTMPLTVNGTLTLPAGTWWIKVWDLEKGLSICCGADEERGCGFVDDNKRSDSNDKWHTYGEEAYYNIRCTECPELKDPSVSPNQATDNRTQWFIYYVTYNNSAGVAPADGEKKIRIKKDGAWQEWQQMGRVSEDPPNYVGGERYKYAINTRLGVGDAHSHEYEIEFKTETGLKAALSRDGPKIDAGYPTIDFARFSPAVAKLNESVSFTSQAQDTDSNNHITNYHWRVVDVSVTRHHGGYDGPGADGSRLRRVDSADRGNGLVER